MMKKLKQLPQITEEALGGLVADEQLKYRILHAAREKTAPRRRARWVPIVAGALALVLAIGTPILVNRSPQPTVINIRAGGTETEVPTLLAGGVSAGQVSASTGSAGVLWEESQSGSFPLIGIEKRYYRMTNLTGSSSLRGRSLGKVNEFTTEPALSDGKTLISNIAATGTEIYEVSGMGGAMIMAEVNGENRVFQRVSFNGMSVRGNEKLKDTLKIAGHVTQMELSGYGTVTDSAALSELTNLLLQNAVFESNAQLSTSDTLLISLDSGLSVQLLVRNDKLSACGTWSCPEFFESFEKFVQ